nr:glycoside hydrolase [uncultured bacterium]
MKKSFFVAAVFSAIIAAAVGAYAQQNGVTTRYWDACKPSCGWSANAGNNPNGTCKSCNAQGSVLSDNNAKNACESGGTAYTCMKQAPWKVNDNLSYGFAATNTNGACGKCFELSFTSTSISGKKMVVMASNIGGDVGQTHFDIMIPGGGVGIYNAVTNQLKENGVSNPNLGAQYGGFRTTCGNNKDCVRKMCNDAFGTAALADLKAGCDWYVDWFDIADNPSISYKEVTCPQELIEKYKGNFSATPPINPTTFTITFNANSGTVSPTSGTTGTNGKLTSLPTPARSGYTFNGWFTAATGGTSVTTNTVFTSNTTIYAQWTAAAATYTVTFNVNGGNSVNPASGTTGTDGKLTSLPTPTRSNYTFTGWFTAATGGTSVTTSTVFTANAIIYAQWTATAATCTITFNANGGTVTPCPPMSSGIMPSTVSQSGLSGFAET